MSIKWDWFWAVTNYFRYLTNTIELTLEFWKKSSCSIKSDLPVDLKEVMEKLYGKELIPGKNVIIRGVYSEFVPMLNISHLFPKFTPTYPPNDYTRYLQTPLQGTPEFALPLRSKPIRGIGLGCLYNKYSTGVYDDFIPIFYKKNLFNLQKNITGMLVEVNVRIIRIPLRWSKLLVPHKAFEYNSDDMKSVNCIGLVLNDIKVLKCSNKFLVDLWRLDHFPYKGDDEDCYEFYQKVVNSKNWPDLNNYIMSYLYPKLRQFDSGILTYFGIIPRVNAANSNLLENERNHLKNFYKYGYQQSLLRRRQWFPLHSAGHGLFDPHKFNDATMVFHYDQVNPIFDQQFKYNDLGIPLNKKYN